MFSFKASLLQVYTETPWSNEKMNEEVKLELETDATSLSIDSEACSTLNFSLGLLFYQRKK